jgi:NTE family protein
MSKNALYLSGGGARAAYQAGVIKGIYSILKTPHVPFELITGVSAGCVNACILTQHADNFQKAVDELEELWSTIKSSYIFSTNHYEITKSVMRSLGLLFLERRKAGYLLDTTPLRAYLNKHINFKKISKNIEKGLIKNLEIICSCYDTQQNISFCQQNDPDFKHWQHYKHISNTTEINVDHLLASGALPLFFSPISIDDKFFGDGSMGLISPLRGPISSKAQKILIISNRHPMGMVEKNKLSHIGFAQILGGMLNSLFQDNLDRDIEIVNQLNDIQDMVSMWNKRNTAWRQIDTLHLRPSVDLAKLAIDNYDKIPSAIKTLLSFFGAGQQSGDLTSFLLFESSFTTEIFNLGFDETLENSEAILQFFHSEND